MVTTRSSKSKIPETPKEPEKMEVEKSEEAKATEKRQLIVEDIKGQFKELEKAAQMIEPRQVSKVDFLSTQLNIEWGKGHRQ